MTGGTVTLPLIGDVDVQGLSVKQAERRLVERLADGYIKYPNVTIEVLKFRPFYVIGEVRAPGSYPYELEISVLQAIAIAGGYTYRADQDDIEILRASEAEFKVIEGVDEDTVIIPGDIISIKERFF